MLSELNSPQLRSAISGETVKTQLLTIPNPALLLLAQILNLFQEIKKGCKISILESENPLNYNKQEQIQYQRTYLNAARTRGWYTEIFTHLLRCQRASMSRIWGHYCMSYTAAQGQCSRIKVSQRENNSETTRDRVLTVSIPKLMYLPTLQHLQVEMNIPYSEKSQT